MRLLSLQHWAQTQLKTSSENGRCYESTDGKRCVLNWNFGDSKRTVALGRTNDVATFSLAPGSSHFGAFCCEAEMDVFDMLRSPIALPSGIISGDDEDDDEVEPQERNAETRPWVPTPSTASEQEPDSELKDKSTQVDFNLDEPNTSTSEGEEASGPTSIGNVIIDEEDRQPSDLAELLKLRHQFGHISMRKLKEMAKQGLISKRLAKCRKPPCSACLYSKATKRPWRGKESRQGDGRQRSQCPGHFVSVDQLVSPTPGLIAQITGFLTTKRYKYATIYVDQ